MMRAWLGKLISADDAEVSVLHVVLVFAIAMFAIPVLFVAGLGCGYAWTHGWVLMPDFGKTVRDLADAYAYVTGSTGVAWALKGGGQALGNFAERPH
jgi:hypothetical protein